MDIVKKQCEFITKTGRCPARVVIGSLCLKHYQKSVNMGCGDRYEDFKAEKDKLHGHKPRHWERA